MSEKYLSRYEFGGYVNNLSGSGNVKYIYPKTVDNKKVNHQELIVIVRCDVDVIIEEDGDVLDTIPYGTWLQVNRSDRLLHVPSFTDKEIDKQYDEYTANGVLVSK
jgi:hypothetical protein